jgi:alanyl-tRNA synthetase
LQSALRQVLGNHVAQSGSLVAPDRFRFDFSHYEGVSGTKLREVEFKVNQHIRENTPVIIEEMEIQEAREKGATALFGEKYGDVVRVVQLDDYSMELCGGTHIKMTGEIGSFKIISEGSIAAGVRRIEALTGESAYIFEREMQDQLMKIVDLLRVRPSETLDRIEALLQQNKDLEKEIAKLQQKSVMSQAGDLLSKVVDVKGVQVLAVAVDSCDRNALRSMVDDLKVRIGSGVIVLGAVDDGKANFIAGVTDDLIKRGLKAGDIIKRVAEIAGGSGGGRPDMAQAGGKDTSKVSEAVAETLKVVSEKLGSLVMCGE